MQKVVKTLYCIDENAMLIMPDGSMISIRDVPLSQVLEIPGGTLLAYYEGKIVKNIDSARIEIIQAVYNNRYILKEWT